MEDIVDLIATDSSASDISDQIKQALFMKSAEKIENAKFSVAASLFGQSEEDEEDYSPEDSSEDQE